MKLLLSIQIGWPSRWALIIEKSACLCGRSFQSSTMFCAISSLLSFIRHRSTCALKSSDITVTHVVSLPNLSSVHVKKFCKQTPNQSPIFATFVEYSHEKNMVDVISNEVPRNKF